MTYTGYPATLRADNKTEICPECGICEAFDVAGFDKADQDKIIVEIRETTEDDEHKNMESITE